MKIVGQKTPLIDSRFKVTGAAQYATDFILPFMLYGKILRSELHHARVLNVDTSRAARLPGVKAVVTSKDFKPIRYGFGDHRADMYALAIDKVRFIGDEVAAVAAADADTAEEALDLIDVEYEPLPPVFDPEESMQEGAPQLHDDAPLNIGKHLFIDKGDVDVAFQEAAAVVEGRFVAQRVHQCYLEPASCIASWDESGKLTVIASNMWNSGLRNKLAQVLDLPVSKVRFIQPYVGGSFGSKVTLQSIYPVAAQLAKLSGRPVKMVNTREEEYFATRPRVAVTLYVKTAARRDGTLLAREVRMINDCGAYCDMAPAMLTVMSHRSDSLYRIPNIRTDARLVYTNKSPIGAYRGYGNPQCSFAYESQLDTLAEKLGIDPLELRLKNATREGDTSVHGWQFQSCGLEESIRKVAERSNWRERHGKRTGSRGLGVACTIHEGDDRHAIGFAGSNAFVEIIEDGRAIVTTGEGDYGQGCRTVFAQIAAEVLGLPLEHIEVRFPDSDRSPYALGPWGSRITISGGNAVRMAAEDARRQLLEIAADALEAPTTDLDVDNGKIFVEGSPDRFVTVAEAANTALHRWGGGLIMGKGTEEPSTTMMDPTKQSNPCSAYSFAAQVAEVEVDTKTGHVEVAKLYTCNDGGNVLNPLNAQGQVEGCALQGIGYGLVEDMKFNEDGQLMTPSFMSAGVPNAFDMPPIEVHFANTYEPYGPFGAKGLAELGAPPAPAAIANAIHDAVGVRITDLPITPEKVLLALDRKGNQSGGEV
ncbi:MAG: xanthine dehydrogenase family protein molybdopterin-binding subunit [Chloroflexi bacterium]|nr:xanthine dehydrogenase family protein molybdopterin-binding subunit [Chloroflexota bacterium]